MSGSTMGFRERALLSMQRALWDMVTPELRGVAMSWGESRINARFVYDLQGTEPVAELVHEIETQVLADFDEELVTEFRIQAIPQSCPRSRADGEWWVYLRREV